MESSHAEPRAPLGGGSSSPPYRTSYRTACMVQSAQRPRSSRYGCCQRVQLISIILEAVCRFRIRELESGRRARSLQPCVHRWACGDHQVARCLHVIGPWIGEVEHGDHPQRRFAVIRTGRLGLLDQVGDIGERPHVDRAWLHWHHQQIGAKRAARNAALSRPPTSITVSSCLAASAASCARRSRPSASWTQESGVVRCSDARHACRSTDPDVRISRIRFFTRVVRSRRS